MSSNTSLYACDGKQRFDTYSAGERVLKRMRGYRRDRKAQINLYRCPYCHGWHIGQKF